MSQTISTAIDVAKQVAAFNAVDNHIKDGMVVAIGTGSTVPYAIQRIARNNLDITCIGLSEETEQLIRENGIKLIDLKSGVSEVDVYIDGFDELDVNSKLIAIAGGCGRVAAVKVMANSAKQVVLIGDHSKRCEHLGQNYSQGIAIEVISMAYQLVSKQIEKTFNGKATLRTVTDSRDQPFVTQFHNYIIDWKFNAKDISGLKWIDIYKTIKTMSGVVDMGLVLKTNDWQTIVVYTGQKDGRLDSCVL